MIERIGWEPREGERTSTRRYAGHWCPPIGVLGADPQAHGLAMEIERSPGRRPGTVARHGVVWIWAAQLDGRGLRPVPRGDEDRQDPQEELRYLYALPDFRDEVLVDRTTTMHSGPDIRA